MLTFALQSGSNGNCIYVEAGDVRLLFDAGLTGRQVHLRLGQHQRDVRAVSAVVISHSHNDHTRGAGVLHRLFHLPLYATPGTHGRIAPMIGRLNGVQHFQPGQTLQFGPVTVHTLPTPHDADEAVAFVVEFEGRRLGIFTDLGHPFAALQSALEAVDAAYLESNYDPLMLDAGTYPPELKARIRGPGGHLSNDEAAEMLKRCGRQRPRWVVLAHLSEHNNHPDIALATHRRELGQDYPFTVASRYRVSDVFTV